MNINDIKMSFQKPKNSEDINGNESSSGINTDVKIINPHLYL